MLALAACDASPDPTLPSADEPTVDATESLEDQNDASTSSAYHRERSAASVPAEAIPAAAVFTGDLDEMVERRVIRALVPYSPIFFFVDENARPRGISQDYLAELENYLNEQLATGTIPLSVAAVPVTRERLIPWLLEGRGDVIVADLTVTEARQQRMLFSEPIARGISEIVVSGPSSEPIDRLEQLAGRQVLARPDSSYFESLSSLSDRLQAAGEPAIQVELAPPHFEDGDVLEMVNAGIADHAVVDGYMASYWRQVLPDLELHPELALRQGADIAWAVRRQNTQLKAQLDGFMQTHRDGTLFGNITIDRYLDNPKWISNPHQQEAMGRFNQMAHLFQQYARSYDLDWLLLVAQGYQESTLDQSVRSPAGAIGVMQLLQSTADDMDVGDILELENNIHAGIKYVRFVIDTFFDDPAIDEHNRILLALASYNAGPGRIRSLRQQAAAQGLDPNQWFDHVEVLAAQDIGRETVNYVRNIYKYYVAYRMILRQQQEFGIGQSD
ncbi:MAG: transporter substrate-binding domain-containing protein [Pseudomonadota bacterium]